MHGRVGVFIPKKSWLDRFINKRVCVIGSISHRSGMTPQQLAQLASREVTSAAVDSQWRFDAADADLAK